MSKLIINTLDCHFYGYLFNAANWISAHCLASATVKDIKLAIGVPDFRHLSDSSSLSITTVSVQANSINDGREA